MNSLIYRMIQLIHSNNEKTFCNKQSCFEFVCTHGGDPLNVTEKVFEK